MMKANIKDIVKELNKRQNEAVTWGEGPLLIIAGAGTGKTKVITHRIAWLIATKRARPEEALGLTFTDKAANEMEERVDILVPYGWVPINISTFHSFGQHILRDYAFELGIDPDFQILTTPEMLVFLKEHIFELPLDYFRPLSNPTKYLQALLDVISRAKDEDVTAEEYLAFANSLIAKAELPEAKEEAEKHLEVARCYEKYEELLVQSGYLDMASLITLPLRLLRTKPSILKKLQSQFKYVLVDEFQDTNYAQFQLLKLLTASHRNITVVGDDDQSIYKFRGACLANILSFRDIYPDAKEVVLTKNYRSTQAILDTARSLIVFNNPNRLEVKAGIDKRIVGDKPNGVEVRHLHYDTRSDEADGVAALIDKLVKRKRKKGRYKYSDFAILVRTNRAADPFLRALNMQGIPWTFSGNQGLYDRVEVKILISLLNVLRDVNDSQSLYYLINSSAYGLNPLDLSRCLGVAMRGKRPLHWVFNNLDEVEGLSSAGKSKIKNFLKDLEYFSNMAASQPAGKVLYEFLNHTLLLKQLVSQPSIENEIAIKNIAEFLKIVDSIGSLISVDRVPFIVEHIESLRALGDNPPMAEAEFDVDAVHVLTVHKAKGLEFRVVFLVSLVSNIFPHRKMPRLVDLPLDLVKEPIPDLPDADVHQQEERRLFYVGMTRAQEELILTSARDYGGKRERRVSEFIIEALDLTKEKIIPQKVQKLEQLKRYGKVEESEPEYLERSGLLVLSSTGIDDWLTCPRKFWYIHRLKVPTPKHHTIVYGTAVHKALAAYLKAKKESKKFKLKDMIDVFESSWVSEGFISQQHEEERFKKGKETIAQFFEREEKLGVVPTLVEEKFSFMLDDIRVEGRWDRVDDDNIIIDYKTGDVLTKKQADQRVRNSVQLSIYTLAYKERFAGQLPARVELHFVDTRITGELKNIAQKTEKIKGIIKEVAAGIRRNDFEHRPQYRACDFCPCRTLCTYTP